MLFRIPQLRALDGTDISPEEKIKAENLHGLDLNDRETIFRSILPEEEFVDRRISKIEDIEPESEDNPEAIEVIETEKNFASQQMDIESVASRTGIVSVKGSIQSQHSS